MTGKRILVVTAVKLEQDAIVRGTKGDPRFDVIAGGVGAAASAVSTTKALKEASCDLKAPYDLVIIAGIAGGFVGQAEIGTLVLADTIVAADLGVETPEGFQSLDELGFGETRIDVDMQWLTWVGDALQAANLTVKTGLVLTVSTVTGTSETAAQLAARVPGAVAEAMEGYGAALAAQCCGVPVLELRAISNPVGPRDRASWRMDLALSALEAASSILVEVL